MNIAVTGLGLIGGSIAKAVKLNTSHFVYGADADEKTLSSALKDGAIDKVFEEKDFPETDIIFVCLFPEAAVKYIRENARKLIEGCIVTDVCGIKGYIEENADGFLRKKGVHFVGGHPMAGKERSGYINSDSSMLKGASYILTKNESTDERAFQTVRELVESFGCRVVETTAKRHDEIIAYTSQLAHVVSSSYIKSPTVENESGFTGGSFQDMTRVALLSPGMWTELFLFNKDNLLSEIKSIVKNLKDFEEALENGDSERLFALLQEGSEIKKKHLK